LWDDNFLRKKKIKNHALVIRVTKLKKETLIVELLEEHIFQGMQMKNKKL
jgi:hypothetical protein